MAQHLGAPLDFEAAREQVAVAFGEVMERDLIIDGWSGLLRQQPTQCFIAFAKKLNIQGNVAW